MPKRQLNPVTVEEQKRKLEATLEELAEQAKELRAKGHPLLADETERKIKRIRNRLRGPLEAPIL